jgi:hypothetical protein
MYVISVLAALVTLDEAKTAAKTFIAGLIICSTQSFGIQLKYIVADDALVPILDFLLNEDSNNDY